MKLWDQGQGTSPLFFLMASSTSKSLHTGAKIMFLALRVGVKSGQFVTFTYEWDKATATPPGTIPLSCVAHHKQWNDVVSVAVLAASCNFVNAELQKATLAIQVGLIICKRQ